MKKWTIWTNFPCLQTAILLFVFANFPGCRLTDKGPHAEIFPSNGSTNVPVNTIIKIRYAADLKVKPEQMTLESFAVNECSVNKFGYLNSQKPKSDTENSDKSKDTDKKSDKNKKSTETQDAVAADNGTTFGAAVDFKLKPVKGTDGTISYYLLINPDRKDNLLKPSQKDAPSTYCVQTKAIKNQDGVIIDAQQTSFTTEEATSFNFSPRIDSVFFAENISPSAKNETGAILDRDFVLVHFAGAISPDLVKKNIRLCKARTDNSKSTADSGCRGDFDGKVINADVFLIENLTSDENNLIKAKYNIYAISPRLGFEAGKLYKVVLSLDTGKEGETNVGYNEHEFPTLEEPVANPEEDLSWEKAYHEEIRDSAGKSVFSPTQQFFFIGVSSGTSQATSSATASTKPVSGTPSDL